MAQMYKKIIGMTIFAVTILIFVNYVFEKVEFSDKH
jgi:hypothetical protein